MSKFLAGRDGELSLKRSAVLDWEDLRTNDTIFLGSAKANLQLKDLPIEQDFVIDRSQIYNRRPQPGERESYRGHGDGDGPLQTHALITRLSAMPGCGEILVLASSASSGTWAAVEYVLQPDNVRDLMRRLRASGGRVPQAYQVLLEATFKGQVPTNVSYVTHHVLRSHAAAGSDRSP